MLAYCLAPNIAHAIISPSGDIKEGQTVTVTCEVGFQFDAGVASPLTATCVKDTNGGQTIEGVDYLGVFDKALPACVPVAPAPIVYEEMPASMQGLNMECSKWRDNKNGKGKDLAFTAQLAQMAHCMAQDCAQSMVATTTCRYADDNRLCYTLTGQIWCKDHLGNPACLDLGDKAGDSKNLDGDGAWAPRLDVPVFGSAKLTAPSATYACNCLKNCAHSTAPNTLIKYWCTGGVVGPKVGQITGSPAQDLTAASIMSMNKNGMCACSCGIVGQKTTWKPGSAQ